MRQRILEHRNTGVGFGTVREQHEERALRARAPAISSVSRIEVGSAQWRSSSTSTVRTVGGQVRDNRAHGSECRPLQLLGAEARDAGRLVAGTETHHPGEQADRGLLAGEDGSHCPLEGGTADLFVLFRCRADPAREQLLVEPVGSR